MGRLEAFALGNKPWPSALDAIGNSLGYGMVLVIVSFLKSFLVLENYLDLKFLEMQQNKQDYMRWVIWIMV